MQASQPDASTTFSSTPVIPHAHGRPFTPSDPCSQQAGTSSHPPPASSSSFSNDYYDITSTPDWQHASAHPSPDPDFNSRTVSNLQSHAATAGTASPQSMVSSGSPKGNSPAGPSPPADAPNPSSRRAEGKKRRTNRNRRPCKNCSISKRKCEKIPNEPNLCKKCKSLGAPECPPHIPWSTRKASWPDSRSLSPHDVDEGALSSSSGSPSCPGTGPSPVSYSGAFQNQMEHGTYGDLSATQDWVHAQTQAHANLHPEFPNSLDMGTYDAFYASHAHHPNTLPASPNLNANFVHDNGMHMNADPIPYPVCHNCQTPYDENLMHRYVMARLHPDMYSQSYEIDQTLLKSYGHVPPSDDSFKGPY